MAVYVGSSGVELDRGSDATGYGNNAEGRLLAYSSQGNAANNTSTVYFKGQVSCSTGSVYNYDAHASSISGTGPMGDGHNATQTWAFGSVPDTSGHEVTGDSSDMYWSGLKHRADGTCSLTLNASGTRGNNSGFSTNISITLPTITRTYTVSYSANGGSGAPNSQTKTYGVNLTLSSTKPTRNGYTFTKGNTAANGTGTNYNSGGTYTANSGVTLYAQWTPSTFTVSYDANGGTGAPGNQTKTTGVDLTLSSITPTGSGHTFKNGNTSQNGTGTMYSPGGNYTANAAVVLYAQGDIDPYIITFNANGGVGVPNPSTKIHDTVIYLPTETPSRVGYTFFRGNTLANGTGRDFSPGGKFDINANTILYAKGIQNVSQKDILHDGFIKVNGNGIPCFFYVNMGNTGYFNQKTVVKVNNIGKNINNKEYE